MKIKQRRKRQYGLFEKQDGKWVRLCPSISAPLPEASKIFQTAMLASAMGLHPNERKLRPLGPATTVYEFPTEGD